MATTKAQTPDPSTELTAEQVAELMAALESEASEAVNAAGSETRRGGRAGTQRAIPMSPLLAAVAAKHGVLITVGSHGSRGHGQPKEGPLPVLTGGSKAIVDLFTTDGGKTFQSVPLERFLTVAFKAWTIKQTDPAERFLALVSRLARVSERRVAWNQQGQIRLSDTTDAGSKG